MKPYLLDMLKQLAILGALHGKVELSSSQLGRKLNLSQQTTSRHLIALEKLGYIKREFGVRKQRISISDKGRRELEKEYEIYRRLFEKKDTVYISGKIISGMGEGRYYTVQEEYVRQFKEKLGFIPFPGTLNIEVDQLDLSKLHFIKSRRGIEIEAFSTPDRSFGSVMCYHASINGLKCAAVFPSRSHYSNIVELISPYNLRETLNLKDGDKVEVAIRLGYHEKSRDS